MQCVNTIGSYYCSCFLGFQLMSDNYTCEGKVNYNIVCVIIATVITDINECSDNNGGCEDVCNNTIGSYSCSCQTNGYNLDANRLSCSGTVC